MTRSRSGIGLSDNALRQRVRCLIDRAGHSGILTSAGHLHVAEDHSFSLDTVSEQELRAIIAAAQEQGKLPTPLRSSFLEGLRNDHEVLDFALKRLALHVARHVALNKISGGSGSHAALREETKEIAEAALELQRALERVERALGADGERISPRLAASMKVASALYDYEEIKRYSLEPWYLPPASPLSQTKFWTERLRMQIEPALYATERRGRPRTDLMHDWFMGLFLVWLFFLAGQRRASLPSLYSERAGGDGGIYLRFVIAATEAMPVEHRYSTQRVPYQLERWLARTRWTREQLVHFRLRN